MRAQVYPFQQEMQPARPYPSMAKHNDLPETEASIRRAWEESNAERQRLAAEIGQPIPLHPAPEFHPVVRALRGEVKEDTCTACGHPTIDHVGGCALAMRQNKPMQTSWPIGVLYGDSWPEVTRAITIALEDTCGPAVAVLFEAMGNDERLMLARQLSRVAVSAHLKEMAK
jgi:hypothetical protein